MKRLLIILFVLSFASVAATAFAGELSGVITETKCGAAHKAGSEKDISCIKSCAKSGAGKLALLAGDKLYTITNPEKATGHEGHTVNVTGKTDESAKTVTMLRRTETDSAPTSPTCKAKISPGRMPSQVGSRAINFSRR